MRRPNPFNHMPKIEKAAGKDGRMSWRRLCNFCLQIIVREELIKCEVFLSLFSHILLKIKSCERLV